MARDLDLGSGHTAYRRHSSTSTYMQNFIEIKETFLWTYIQMEVWTFETGYIRSKGRPKYAKKI